MFYSNKCLSSKAPIKFNEQAKNSISGKILFSESTANPQIVINSNSLPDDSSPTLIISGFSDNSVKILKDFKIYESLNFHNVIIFSIIINFFYALLKT